MWKILLLMVLSIVTESVFAVKGLDVSLANNHILLTERHGGDGSAWGLARCESCHVLNSIHKDAPKVREIVVQKGFDTCSGCHGSNGTEMQRPCAICHNTLDLPDSPVLEGAKKHDFDAKNLKGLADAQCLVCHDASDMDGQFENAIDLTRLPNKAGYPADYSNSSEFCLRCHNRDHQQPGFAMQEYDYRHAMTAMEDNWRAVDVHGYPKGSGQRTYSGLRENVYQYASVVECVDCHAMHGTHNDKLLIDSSATGVFRFNPSFRKQPFQVDVRGNDYSQLCVLCHAMEKPAEAADKNTGNGLKGVHQVGSDCFDCHAHGMAVQTGL